MKNRDEIKAKLEQTNAAYIEAQEQMNDEGGFEEVRLFGFLQALMWVLGDADRVPEETP